MSQKIVMTGIGGIWGNRGGVKQFATCRVCNEIMFSTRKRNKPLKIILIIIGIYFGISILLQFVLAILRLIVS